MADFFELILSISVTIGKPGVSAWVNTEKVEALVTAVTRGA